MEDGSVVGFLVRRGNQTSKNLPKIEDKKEREMISSNWVSYGQCSKGTWSIVCTQLIQVQLLCKPCTRRWEMKINQGNPSVVISCTRYIKMDNFLIPSEQWSSVPRNPYGFRCVWKQSTQSPSCSPIYCRWENIPRVWEGTGAENAKTYSSSVTMNHYSSNVTSFYCKTWRLRKPNFTLLLHSENNGIQEPCSPSNQERVVFGCESTTNRDLDLVVLAIRPRNT